MSSKVVIPALLDLSGQRILFVGGGEGTRTKLASLVEQDPKVRIVAPEVSSQVEALVGKLSDAELHRRRFAEKDLDGVALVYGFTDDEALNAHLATLCRARGLWNNVSKNRGAFSFVNPAVARKNGVIAAFSSEEGKPGVAVQARDQYLRGRE